MKTIHADEIQPGDVLVYHGDERRIARIDRRPGWAWPIATDDCGWAIALGDDLIDVERITVCFTPHAEATTDRNVTTPEQAAMLGTISSGTCRCNIPAA